MNAYLLKGSYQGMLGTRELNAILYSKGDKGKINMRDNHLDDIQSDM